MIVYIWQIIQHIVRNINVSEKQKKNRNHSKHGKHWVIKQTEFQYNHLTMQYLYLGLACATRCLNI